VSPPESLTIASTSFSAEPLACRIFPSDELSGAFWQPQIVTDTSAVATANLKNLFLITSPYTSCKIYYVPIINAIFSIFFYLAKSDQLIAEINPKRAVTKSSLTRNCNSS
jgi:hypothetical protein